MVNETEGGLMVQNQRHRPSRFLQHHFRSENTVIFGLLNAFK